MGYGICPRCGQSTKDTGVFECKECHTIFCGSCRGGNFISAYFKIICPSCGAKSGLVFGGRIRRIG